MLKLVIVALSLAAAPPALGQQSSQQTRSTARLGALRPAASDPYQKLFQPTPPVAPPLRVPPKVVCGMTLIPADPSIDPRVLVSPKDDGVEYTLRVIDPPLCKPPR